MRSKVLTEITEKNKLKEDIKEMKSNHRKELSQQSKRLEGLETMLRKIQDENEQLRDKYDRARREYRSESELEKLVNKLGDIETRYHKEK
jgi:thiamine kinase-like enzyme